MDGLQRNGPAKEQAVGDKEVPLSGQAEQNARPLLVHTQISNITDSRLQCALIQMLDSRLLPRAFLDGAYG